MAKTRSKRRKKGKRMRFKLASLRHIFIERKLKILGIQSCRQLAAAYRDEAGEEVCPKTIMRDVGFMRDRLGAPIEYNSSLKGYYYADKSFSLPTVQISEGELFALAVAQKAVAHYKGAPIGRKLQKIFERICSTLPDSITVNPHDIDQQIGFNLDHASEIDPAIWEKVEKGLNQHHALEMEYFTASKNKITERTVEPYHLHCFRGDWYLIGKDSLTGGHIRIFALRRIRRAKMLHEQFQVDPRFTPEDYFKDTFGLEKSSTTYQVKIKFDPSAAIYIREKQWHPKQQIKEHKESSLTLSFPTNSIEEVKRWVLSWSGQARPLAPKTLVDSVKQSAKSLLITRGKE